MGPLLIGQDDVPEIFEGIQYQMPEPHAGHARLFLVLLQEGLKTVGPFHHTLEG